MTVKELYDIFMKFKDNDFLHLVKKVDRILWFLLTGFMGIITALIVSILKK